MRFSSPSVRKRFDRRRFSVWLKVTLGCGTARARPLEREGPASEFGSDVGGLTMGVDGTGAVRGARLDVGLAGLGTGRCGVETGIGTG